MLPWSGQAASSTERMIGLFGCGHMGMGAAAGSGRGGCLGLGMYRGMDSMHADGRAWQIERGECTPGP